MHRLVLHNDEICDAAEARLSLGQVGFMTGWGVFSTLRISRGVPFAFERHFDRMRRDAALLRVPFPNDPFWLEERLVRLVEANNATEAVLRVNVVRNRGGLFEGPELDRDFDVIAFTAELKTWGDSVRLGVVPNARHAGSKFAGTKVTSWLFNLNLYEEAHERGFDEVLLLTENGEVSECTSANIFAVFGDEVRTPPLSSGCLPGVTRDVLLTDIRVPGVRLVEATLALPDLSRADEVFITSTTRDVLPVAEIEGMKIRAGRRIVELLGRALRTYREEYVCSRAAAADLHD
jgi:branched-subunit amino acid aminotransferase/4-amino-4-deoxychorismate lyase